MPKPGPRPYECVRKAWHSDRHQPIRGSLIQEIFRIVKEIHSSPTMKNKEWQEKLPVVVLRAEEIMYSKANSEAEYMDIKTLENRLNDAIDTIIRRDDTITSEYDLLQPCIEAALHLGCIPRRTSRSQRNNSATFGFQYVPKFGSESNKMLPNSCSMYPLYHGFQYVPEFGKKSVALPVEENNEIVAPRLSHANAANGSCRVPDIESQAISGCDLSLRLGSFVGSVDNEKKTGDGCKLN